MTDRINALVRLGVLRMTFDHTCVNEWNAVRYVVSQSGGPLWNMLSHIIALNLREVSLEGYHD